MAVVNTKSTMITNSDATPAVLTGSHVAEGKVVECVGYVEVAAADDNDSIYRMVRIPSNAKISAVFLKHDAVADGTDFNIGLYDTAAKGGAVITTGESAIADAVNLTSARTVWTEISTAISPEESETRAWGITGLTADPDKDFDVCLKGIAVGTGAGTVALKVQYVL